MDSLTESILRSNWADALAVERMFNAKGFWVCDLGLAADRKLSQQLKEQREVELADGGGDGVDTSDKEATYEVERIVSHEKDRKSGEFIYVVKWKDFESKHNTKEPETHLAACSPLLAYWKGKIKGKKPSPAQQEQVARVTKLQEAALREQHEATRRRTQPLSCEPARPACAGNAASGGLPSTARPTGVPEGCRISYDRAHQVLSDADCLIFDTETGGFTTSVLNIGWILASNTGDVLATYERLWRLPAHERIDRRALKAHGITAAQLAREGVAANHR